MSDIKKGDLVMVVRVSDCPVCKPTPPASSRLFVVSDIRESVARCESCRHVFAKQPMAYVDALTAYALWRLKRIPPLEELEGTKEALQQPIPTQKREVVEKAEAK